LHQLVFKIDTGKRLLKVPKFLRLAVFLSASVSGDTHRNELYLSLKIVLLVKTLTATELNFLAF